jgi:Transposase DDE domain
MHKINSKIEIIMNYINSHNLNEKILDSTNYNTKYTIDELLKHYFIYEHFCTSYIAYHEICKFFDQNKKHPCKSRINTFVKKLSKMCIFEKAFDYHNKNVQNNVNNNKSNIVLLDSCFVPNYLMSKKEPNCVGINAFYKSKYGCKLSVLTDVNGYPLKIDISSGNKNDAKIATEWIESFTEDSKSILNNKHLLGDSGYDSSTFKSVLVNCHSTYTIPKNIRNETSEEYKKQKSDIIENVSQNKKQIWKNIRCLKKIRNKKLNKKEKVKHDNLRQKERLKLRKELCEIEKKKKEDLQKILIEKRIQTKKKNKDKKKSKKRKFNLSLSDKEHKIYKNRIHIEHTFSQE